MKLEASAAVLTSTKAAVITVIRAIIGTSFPMVRTGMFGDMYRQQRCLWLVLKALSGGAASAASAVAARRSRPPARYGRSDDEALIGRDAYPLDVL
eukprot:1319662-Pleurochrysis_carterae.AAC.5